MLFIYTPVGQPNARAPSLMRKRSPLTLTKIDAPGTTAHMLMPAHFTTVEVPNQPPSAHFTIPSPDKRSKHPTYAMAHNTSRIICTTHSPQHCTNAPPNTQIVKHTLRYLPLLVYRPHPQPHPLHPLLSHQ